MKERIIVSLTTYSKRINNIPAVLDTIFSQTVPPDFVVLNLAYEEIVPEEVQRYIDTHPIEVNRVADTKVFKKLLPTLKKYPNDCIIAIDDDWLYPKGMIADFIKMHERYPHCPISGNRIILFGRQCHCGCASLVKSEYFGGELDLIDDDVFRNCPSDDIVYTYFVNKAGFSYIRTAEVYYKNMVSYNEGESYTVSEDGFDGIAKSYSYLENRFGRVDAPLKSYISDSYIADLLHDIHSKDVQRKMEDVRNEIRSSITYKVGRALVNPFLGFKRK